MNTHDTNANANTDELKKLDRGYFARLAINLVGFALVGVGLIAAVGAAQRMGWISAGGSDTSAASGGGDVIYTCPMDPQIRKNEPSRCDICGMELVPAVSGGGNTDEFSVTIPVAARRLANISTATVASRPVFHAINTVGYIEFDESRVTTIAVYVDGRIERMFADYTGVEVDKGDHLVELYSQPLYAAQTDYIVSRQRNNSSPGSDRLATATRQKLVELGMTDEQIKTLEKTGQAKSRLTVYSPTSGTVIKKMGQEGKYVKAGDPVYQLADLSTVWLMLDLYPEDASLIRYGQVVETELQSLPGEILTGRVAFVDPLVNPKTRTVKVRVELLNIDGKLRPGDYASATVKVPIGAEGQVYDSHLSGKWISPMHPQIIRDEPGQCPICGMDLVSTSRYGYSDAPVPQPTVLVVPRDAVLMAGQNSVVYVEVEEGRFEIRPVVLGPIAKLDMTFLGSPHVAVVHRGLKEGEIVATSGNFLIDSQMQLAGNPSLIDPTRAINRPAEPAPLEIMKRKLAKLGGPAGDQLELLYGSYLKIQARFAADKSAEKNAVEQLVKSGIALLGDSQLPEEARNHVQTIVDSARGLHEMELAKARVQFKPISHNVLQLASFIRGSGDGPEFVHYYCSMVKDGGGDWMQADGELVNPYYGSEMLH